MREYLNSADCLLYSEWQPSMGRCLLTMWVFVN